MELEVKIELLKFCFGVLNSIFLVLGLSVMGCGIWILFDTGNFLQVLSSEELRVVASGLFMIGGVVVLISLTGCAGATMEKRFMLLVYLGFLIVLVLGQLFVTFLLLFNRSKIEKSLTESVDQIIFQYGNNSDSSGSRIMDSVQHSAKCCGYKGPADWLNNSFIKTLNLTSPVVAPCSCFSSFQPGFNSFWCSENSSFFELGIKNGSELFTKNCIQTIGSWLQGNFLTIIVMDAILILLQIAEVSVAAYLFRMFGKKLVLKKSKALLDQSPDPEDSSPDSGLQNHAFAPNEDPTDPNYIPAVDPNHMAYDHYHQNQNQGYQEPVNYVQNQGYQEPVNYVQNQNQGYQEPVNYVQNQNQGYQEPVNYVQNQNQGYQEPVHFYQDQNQGYRHY